MIDTKFLFSAGPQALSAIDRAIVDSIPPLFPVVVAL
jgi:hypothetical protein